MDPDPIKRSLEAIDEELEDAMSQLSVTNQRVDDLLNDYNAGELTLPGPVVDDGEHGTTELGGDDDRGDLPQP
jgi:hypothetical protein